ncbi:MAG: endolytic transglycosylase MltG [Bacteroidales bacterium]|nr:endolytic transglycosylase MltG [Bacteroidales bacterium]
MNKKLIIILAIVAVILISGIGFGFSLLNKKTFNKENVNLYIYPSENYEKVIEKLEKSSVLGEKRTAFEIFSKVKNLKNNVKSGHYVIEPNTSQKNLVRMLANGLQAPVKLVINKVRLKEDFAKKVSEQLMITENDILLAINNEENSENFFDRVVCNTYEVYWNISAESLIERLKKEADKWWEKQENLLEKTGLNRHEVVVLASIVEEETNKNEEKPTIAGVYINRLKKDMLLQADPTVKYAVGDFTIKRVMYKHLQTESPYNTYLNKGLPPTAICLPEISSLKSVLNYQKHNYMFFCAKEDFSGYHNFAVTPNEHYRNAEKYKNALNKLGIK